MSTEQEKATETAASLDTIKSEPSGDEIDSEYCYRSHKTSDPIPIGYCILRCEKKSCFINYCFCRSSHTVSGHEAMHLAKRLNEELAQQQAASRSFGNRAVSPEPEHRSRSYECKSPQCKAKGIKSCY